MSKWRIKMRRKWNLKMYSSIEGNGRRGYIMRGGLEMLRYSFRTIDCNAPSVHVMAREKIKRNNSLCIR